jgi:hypothetical protein
MKPQNTSIQIKALQKKSIPIKARRQALGLGGQAEVDRPAMENLR